MKKIIVAFMSIIAMMIFIAQPIFIKPIYSHASGTWTEFNNEGDYILQDEWNNTNHGTTGTNYNYTTERMISTQNSYNDNFDNDSYFICLNSKKEDGWFFNISIGFNSADVTFINNDLSITNITEGYCRINASKSGGYSDTYYCAISTVDLNFVKDGEYYPLTITNTNGNTISTYFKKIISIGNIWTNIPETLSNEPSLNLQVTFSPSMSGTVTRQGTSNGSDITYNYLNLNIKNNGDNAQWLFCIVPHGQSLSFPNAILNTPQGFIGSPTFVWVCDEWIDWTNGLTGITGNYGGIDMQMLYAPCAWHTLITGSDRTYRINWDMMKLTKDVSYDCVVYGMINEEPVNASDSGTGLGCWTVKSALSGITEVYRSTFTMPNPPEFNPDSIDEGNSAHAWNPDIDNSSLFNHGSVYKDANGNLVIKGSGGITNGTEWELGHHSGSSINTSSAFGGFFGLIKGIFGGLPSEFYIIITFGLVAIVAVGIIKAVK